MHHIAGMGAQKDMGLDAYAKAFAAGGMAAFVFDYRSFGGSEGYPRHWVSPSRHVEDWQAALAYVQAELSSIVDINRICLWGTSFAGGHVLAIASNESDIKAIISQVSTVISGLLILYCNRSHLHSEAIELSQCLLCGSF